MSITPRLAVDPLVRYMFCMVWNRGAAQNHALYSTWREMRRRCENPSRKDFHHYGGRGIQVCERWRLSFWNFVADVGTKPTPDHSLDRIDVDGPYAPENCRWADRATQRTNRRTTGRMRRRPVTAFGVTYGSLMHACDELGVNYWGVRSRLVRGWAIEDAVRAPSLR